jgi:RHS repeat-associated protein
MTEYAGLVNLRTRWYSTAKGRFTSVDPFAGMPETPYSLHQYQYGYSDPVLNSDPSGQVVPVCPIGYRKVIKDGQFAGCEDDPDFPSWLDFLKGSLGPMPIGATAVGGTLPQVGGEAAKQALGKTLEVCASLFTYLVGLQALSDTQAQTQRRQPQRNVVELGPGILPDNLVTLAAFYPDAKLYGVERDAGSAMGAEFVVQQLNLGSRIQIINSSYDTYIGPLQHNADVVVAVEPPYGAPIVAGIRNFIKPGGAVLVVTEFNSVKNEVLAAAGGKAQLRTLTPSKAQGIYTGVQVMQSSLGVPLVSQFVQGHTPWEIFVPSW